jgi:beta propeller repeat protein
MITAAAASGAVTEFAIADLSGDQVTPVIDGKLVVWQDDYYSDSDIFGADITSTDAPKIFAISSLADIEEEAPSIQGKQVALQSNESGNWDILVCQLYYSDANSTWYPDTYALTITGSDQLKPAVWGNNVAWQRPYVDTAGTDLDVEAAAIPNPDAPSAYLVAAWAGTDESDPAIYKNIIVYQGKQTKTGIYGRDILDLGSSEFTIAADGVCDRTNPAIYGGYVVWQDSRNQGDIYMAYAGNPAKPVVSAICTNAYSQQNPAISENIIVWQDNRNGNWDIYGYNILTKQEFRITSEGHDQVNPSISGTIVVWQDYRQGDWDIYGAIISGNWAASCSMELAGDFNMDCKVTMADYAVMAGNWLKCNIDVPGLCG